MPFRKALVWIRSHYLDHPKELFLYSVAAIIVTGAISVLADFMISWEQWGILVRSLLAIPTAAAIFILGYGLTLTYVDYRVAKDPEYKTWRQRLSPLMRQRVAMLIGAVLFVFMFAVAQKPGYTFAASVIVALVVGLFAFIRKTSREITRENIGLPDARDAAFDSHLRAQARKAAAARTLRNRGKGEKKGKKEKLSPEAQAAADREETLALERDLEG